MTDLIDRTPDDMIPDDPDQKPGEPKEQWVLDPNFEENTKTAKRLAFFIMGCLIQEQVVPIGKHGDLMSDIEVGVGIITECLRGNLLEDDLPQLPFDWSAE